MEVIQIKEKKVWENFVLTSQEESFLQSWSWGEFSKSLKKRVWRLAVLGKGEILIGAQVIKENFPFLKRSFFYLPFGPLFKKDISQEIKKRALEKVLKKIKNQAKKEKAIFLRIEPLTPLPADFNFRPALRRIQPQKTLLLDLKVSQEKIFQNFRKGTRYSIKFAEKQGVEINSFSGYQPQFYQLLKETAQRSGFKIFPKIHYQNLFKFFDDNFQVELWLAKYEKKTVVANLLLFYDSQVFYLHSGSDLKLNRKLKAADLLQWEQIKAAKKRGYQIYDFWGIDEKRLPGVTFFKKGFGGKLKKYPQGADLVFDKVWYFLYKTYRKWKEKKF